MSLFNQIIKENGIILEKSILVNNKDNYQIQLSFDDSRNLGEGAGYFKFIPSTNYNAVKEARIYFGKCDYTYHNGKQSYHLDRSEKKSLMKLLSTPINKTVGNLVLVNNWQYLIYEYNFTLNFKIHEIEKYAYADNDVTLPRNFIRLNLPMPNYMNLPNERRK